MFVYQRFVLDSEVKNQIYALTPEFGYGEVGSFIFYRTYSHCKTEKEGYPKNQVGYNETWNDVVIRVTEGTFSIRKDWYIKNKIYWDESKWQQYAKQFALSLFNMEWCPPGRGLTHMGRRFVYERGSMCLYNCNATEIRHGDIKDHITHKLTSKLAKDTGWLMDSLMLGCGVGFEPTREKEKNEFKVYYPKGTYVWVIPDSREGWVESVERLITSFYLPNQSEPIFDYSEIRVDEPIESFGGMCTGPEPLKILHDQIRSFFIKYLNDQTYDIIRLKTDIQNCVGCCVISGNVRRSAELCEGEIDDETFINLKNYNKNPERQSYGFMSNNSVKLYKDEHFQQLDKIAERIKDNGEPGIMNLLNFPYGRIRTNKKDKLPRDSAKLINPCIRSSATLLAAVNVARSIKTVGEIQIGDSIWSESGWTKIINKVCTGVKKVYKYRTTASMFYGTEDHKIISQGWKVKVKDAVSIDSLTYKSDRGVVKVNYDNQLIMDGLVLGDGTYNKGGDRVCLFIGSGDNDYFHSEVGSFISNCYRDYEWNVRTNIKPEELPYTYLRSIPDRYIRGNFDQVCSFLRGVYSANGSVCGNRVTLKTASIKIVDQVQLMLSSIGIGSYFTTNKEKEVVFNNGTYTCKQSYDLNISGDRVKFLELIGFIHKDRVERLEQVIEKIADSRGGKEKITFDIISREYLGEEEVYDITVDNAEHTYWSDGSNICNCGEVPLEGPAEDQVGGEVCNVVETCPMRCIYQGGNFEYNHKRWLLACEFATFYASTVSLLPTHQSGTNQIIARNRRIGVSIVDFIGWKHLVGTNKLIKYLREGYKRVRKINKQLANEAGIPESIRVTTIKPGGSVARMVGGRSGGSAASFRYVLRRFKTQKDSPVYYKLINAGYPHEPDYYSANTEVFEFPVDTDKLNTLDPVKHKPIKTSEDITIWEQALNVILLQREWSDNAVSNTLMFKPKWTLNRHIFFNDPGPGPGFDFDFDFDLDNYIINMKNVGIDLNPNPGNSVYEDKYIKIEINYETKEIKEYFYNPRHEEDDIEGVLSTIVPMIKTLTILPHTPKGVYKQMPEEKLSKEEYEARLAKIKPIDWSGKLNITMEEEKYCQGDKCSLPIIE